MNLIDELNQTCKFSKKSIKLILKEGTTFDLFFYDGSVKRYDILKLADKFPQLNALKDRELFLKGKLIGWSGVYWNDDLDIDCETVYFEGKDVTDEYDDVDAVVFGYSIKERRLELEYSQEDLANKIGMDQSDLSKIEKGLANPSFKTICRIAKGLNCKVTINLNTY